MDFNMLTEAFVVVVIGGLGSIPGAFLASLLVGVLQSFGTLLLPKFTLVMIFIIMAVVLVVRPRGLTNTAQVRQRVAAPAADDVGREGIGSSIYIAGAGLLFLLFAPFFAGGYSMALLIEMLVFVLFAASLHFLIGPCGILSFGHAAYFGLGAYSVAIGVKYLKMSMLPSLAVAPVIAGVGAAIFGWFCIRLSGVYRAMLTLAFAQITWSVFWQWIEVTGGDNGILRIRRDAWALPLESFYFVVLGIVAAGVFGLWRVVSSPYGYALRAARDSELRSIAIGLPIARLQWTAFVVAGTAAGIAGALYAYSKGSVFPDSASIPMSVDGLVMVLLGGIDRLIGPVVGASVYHWLQSELIRTTEYWRSILGGVILALVIAFPDGIAGYAARQMRRIKRSFGGKIDPNATAAKARSRA
jgi:branched-chain amino acid transport system permease protein